MTQPVMSCIEKTCPDCGAANRIVTPDVRPSWAIHCSSCGTVLVARPGFRPRLIQPADHDSEELRGSL